MFSAELHHVLLKSYKFFFKISWQLLANCCPTSHRKSFSSHHTLHPAPACTKHRAGNLHSYCDLQCFHLNCISSDSKAPASFAVNEPAYFFHLQMSALARSCELLTRQGAFHNLAPLLSPPDDAGSVHAEFRGGTVVAIVFTKRDCSSLELHSSCRQPSSNSSLR